MNTKQVSIIVAIVITATSLLRKAIELDRYCAPAYAVLGEAMVRKYLLWDGDHTFLEDARDNADKALALANQSALAHTALGFANHLSGHPEDAQREYRLAIALWVERGLQKKALEVVFIGNDLVKLSQERSRRLFGAFNDLRLVLHAFWELADIADKRQGGSLKQAANFVPQKNEFSLAPRVQH